MKTHVINLLPFNNRMEMSGTEYVIKKILAFVLIFFLSGILGEAVVIGLYTGMGYDPLHGVIPEGQIAGLVPYYGYILFSITAILYCKLIEKRSLQDVGLTKQGTDYLFGIGMAIAMLALVVILCLVTGSVSFWGINRNVSIKGLLLWGVALHHSGVGGRDSLPWLFDEYANKEDIGSAGGIYQFDGICCAASDYDTNSGFRIGICIDRHCKFISYFCFVLYNCFMA